VISAVRREDAAPIPGYERVSTRAFRIPEPLHAVLGKSLPALGRMFEPGRLFQHVGERLCLRPAPGLREEYWVRAAADLEKRMNLAAASPLALAWITAGGIGFVPVVGATLASFVTAAVPFGAGFFWEWDAVRLGVACVVAAATAASLLVERASARHFLSEDAREFVLDEVAGMALTLVFVPAHAWLPGVWIAFLAFRFFDVLKPGIEWVERRNWRGTIVWDDLLAGLYAGLVTAAATHFLP